MMTQFAGDGDEDEVPEIDEESVPKKYRNLYKKKDEPNMDYAMPIEGRQSLDDVGTRYKHMTDLLDLWSIAFEVLKGIRTADESETDKQRVKDLEAAIRLLGKQMEALAGYQDGIYNMASMINSLPKPKN